MTRDSSAGHPVPFFKSDAPPAHLLAPYLAEMARTGRLTNFGPLNVELERRIAAVTGRPALAITSGTAAIYMALATAPVRRENRAVILPSFNFCAALQAIAQTGMRPVFIDIEPDFSISPDRLEAALAATPDCQLVLAPNYYGWAGNPAEVETAVWRFNARTGRDVKLMFDSAHAYGATYNGHAIGGFGDLEVFSFSATKAISGAEGGALVTDDAAWMARLRSSRNYGTENYAVVLPGVNGKLSEPNAAFILARMDLQAELIAHRARLVAEYFAILADVPGMQLPVVQPGWAPVWKDIVVTLAPELAHLRDGLRAELLADGIDTRTYFDPPLHRSPTLAPTPDAATALAVTNDLAARVIGLPFFESMTPADMRRVAARLEAHLGAAGAQNSRERRQQSLAA